jgi:hypothetical protein
MRRNAFDERGKGGVEQDPLVFGVVEDVNELLRTQARVAGVYDHATA